jgi:hypothetical protein
MARTIGPVGLILLFAIWLLTGLRAAERAT